MILWWRLEIEDANDDEDENDWQGSKKELKVGLFSQ